MINTLQIKQQQLSKGYFTAGSGKEVILVMGSCRVVNIVSYLDFWNKANGNRFTIHSIDPFSWNWDINEQRTDYEATLLQLEKHDGLLSMLKSVDWFLHEYYQHSGMFNVNKGSEKNIYQYGISPKLDICLPNWNDNFILANDIVSFDLNIRKKAIQDFNVLHRLSAEVEQEIYQRSQSNLKRFYDICGKSDLPEMKQYFENNFTKKRLFWTSNHTSKYFTLALFKLMNEKYLHLDLTNGFDENHIDIFANNYTYLTELDVKLYGYNWGEEIKPLRDKL